VRTLAMGAVTRSYRVYAGRRYDPTRPAMLVINLHGFTSNALQQELYANMPALADARGFVVASPDGLDASWNAGQCCGLSMTRAVDDVGFIRSLIDAVSAEYCVDPSRVFATGLSNGGFLSHRLACELSDRIAAVAPVAGVVGVPTCTPARAVPVFQFGMFSETDLSVFAGGGFKFGGRVHTNGSLFVAAQSNASTAINITFSDRITAVREVVHRKLPLLDGDGGLIAIDRNGRIVLDFNCSGMYRGYCGPDGILHTAIFR
jgi:poly(3-hydroxybutyrate) depolymerase